MTTGFPGPIGVIATGTTDGSVWVYLAAPLTDTLRYAVNVGSEAHIFLLINHRNYDRTDGAESADPAD